MVTKKVCKQIYLIALSSMSITRIIMLYIIKKYIKKSSLSLKRTSATNKKFLTAKFKFITQLLIF